MMNFYDKHGYPPSVRELAVILDSSTGSIQRQIELLKEIGWISRESNKARTTKFNKQL